MSNLGYHRLDLRSPTKEDRHGSSVLESFSKLQGVWASAQAEGSYLCERCYRLLNRQDSKRAKRGWRIDREVRFRAMQAQRNEAIGGFECHLTKVKLSDDQFSPLRASWEHLEPANEKTAVLAAAIINHMKSDLTESEFRDVVTELARYFAKRNAVFDTTLLPKRPFRPKALS